MSKVVQLKNASAPTETNYKTAIADLRHQLSAAKSKGGLIVREYEALKMQHGQLDQANSSLREERTNLKKEVTRLDNNYRALALEWEQRGEAITERDDKIYSQEREIASLNGLVEHYKQSEAKFIERDGDSVAMIAAYDKRFNSQRMLVICWMTATIAMFIMYALK